VDSADDRERDRHAVGGCLHAQGPTVKVKLPSVVWVSVDSIRHFT
jgi:hypothetical protein